MSYFPVRLKGKTKNNPKQKKTKTKNNPIWLEFKIYKLKTKPKHHNIKMCEIFI